MWKIHEHPPLVDGFPEGKLWLFPHVGLAQGKDYDGGNIGNRNQTLVSRLDWNHNQTCLPDYDFFYAHKYPWN